MTLGRKYTQNSGSGSELRRAYSHHSKVSSLSGCSSSISLCDTMEPPDWEELAKQLLSDEDPLAYPPNDLVVVQIPKKIRTLTPVLPDEDLSGASQWVRECVQCYARGYTALEYRCRAPPAGLAGAAGVPGVAGALERARVVQRHHYEVDMDPLLVTGEELAAAATLVQAESQPSSGRQSATSMSSSSSCNETLTPRGSWASLDLRSSTSDPLLPEVLERRQPEELDALNEARRMEGRQPDLLGLYGPCLDDEDAVERRLPAEMPCEPMGHRIMVQCQQLKLELDIEPIFASMALYDAKERRKLSENFYFNLNSESTRQMLAEHVPHADLSTLSRCAIFDVLHPSPELFLVIRLEKVLQGDINECVEPYLKDDKSREKVRALAAAACERLGRYRMPLAWTAVSLLGVLQPAAASSGQLAPAPAPHTPPDHDKDSPSASNSLDRKSSSSSLGELRRRAGEVGGSLSRKGSLERRPTALAPGAGGYGGGAAGAGAVAQPDDVAALLDSFRPVSLTLNTLFKQEGDKLRDEDLYKFLAEIKRPSSAPKKLKCIPGTLKLEISPCGDEVRNCLTPELAKLHPYGDDNIRPCKEVLPFPLVPLPLPHYQYRSLLYVYPKEFNFNAYQARHTSARNITVRVQLMGGEAQAAALPAIFGRSSCPELATEAYTTVLYHNKSPCLYDEIKLKLPADLGDQHHLLFTFFHVSCQKKPVPPEHEKNVETPIGYTWVPLCRGGRLTCGELALPVMLEEPPPNYSYIFPEVQLPGTRWLDSHKPLFALHLAPASTVHPLDSHIERFAMACEAVQEGNIPARIGVANMEAELRASIAELPCASTEALVKNLVVVLDKVVELLVAPPRLQGQTLNIAQDAFTCLQLVFANVTSMKEGGGCDAHGRSSLLATYIQYQCRVPRPTLPGDLGLPYTPSVSSEGSCKILHEELALQWVVASGSTRDLAMQNSWTLFELMVKSMVEWLSWRGALDSERKGRFPEQFVDDVTTLVNNVTSEIISRYGKDGKLTQSLNNSLAFFLLELMSVMDRGYVFGLLRGYYKQMSAKIASLPDAVPLVHYKLSFLRIVCSHEHYVSLNLPAAAGALAGGTGGAEAQGETRGRHYLAALLLHELDTVLDMQSPALHAAAVAALLARLAAHEADARLQAAPLQARVAQLYLPLLPTVLRVYPRLYKAFNNNNKDRLPLGEEFGQFSQFGSFTPEGDYKQSKSAALNSETTRNLLVCVAWLLKWVDKRTLAGLVAELPPSSVQTLLLLVDLCFKCTEYKGRKEIMKCAQQNVRNTTDIKSKLEDVILGQGSARSELIMRRKGGAAVQSSGKRERWRKEWVRGGGGAGAGAGAGAGGREAGGHGAGAAPHLEAALSAEVALTMLHTLDTILQCWCALEGGQAVCGCVVQVLLRAMQLNQSATVLQHMLAAMRSLILKLSWWEGCYEEGCAGVCRVLLRGCAALSPVPRAHASATLYALMRQNYLLGHNFSRVKMQVTMSLSSLVGTSTTFSEESLRRSLKTILLYAEQDHDLQDTSFPEQVKDLVFNLHMILSDTVKMKEYAEDPEMLLDLMHRIARGYQHSPDLRLTWLNNMAQKHMERGNHVEAGMCLVHGAALVAEQLRWAGRGAALLSHVTHNALLESCPDTMQLQSRHLTHHTLQALLEHGAGELMAAGMYETVNEVYKVLIPIAEENRDYKKLANVHGKLNEAFGRIEQLHGKRVFGTYFRVAFYGARFGDLDGDEFVYKEHALTKLPEIFSRLENFYGQRFGADSVVIIKDSNSVDEKSLDSDKAYIQITYVEPYFEPYELRHRITHYERNHNIKRFMYATPFTVDGRAHGELAEQCKRKTVLTTAHHFPYVKTRIQVVHRHQIILSPIEVAIEDIQKKTSELAAATAQEPADTKMLQMVLQGCIGTTVNQGPLELAQVFLAPVAEGAAPATRHTNKLRLAFKDFSKKCQDALRKNKNLIGAEQREYQRELERNYARFTERLAPLVHTAAAAPAAAPPTNGVSKPEWKAQT